jgi:hypothetical protein
MKLAPFFILFFLSAVSVFPFGKRQAASEPAPNHIQSEQTVDRAQQVMEALLAAYPKQAERAEFRNGDWALLLRGAWFYYAGGRMLPENLLGNTAVINPQPFYNYQKELPPWKEPSAEEAARFREMANNRNQNPLRRSPHFFDTLWRISSRDEAYQRVKTIRFLGKSVNVHYLIMENLALVEEQILAAAKADPQVQAWVNGISTLEGWTWRDIAQTQSRSFHAYGLAVDLLPKSLGGKETYWLWAMRKKPEWWNISYNERYHPPAAVIKAFETYGFVWGGKWLFFDTMHFEYRPEILILGGMPPETRR